MKTTTTHPTVSFLNVQVKLRAPHYRPDRDGLELTPTGIAHVVRAYLKATYPTLRSWATSDHNTLNVYLDYFELPTFAQVKERLEVLQHGYFDGMQDLYINTGDAQLRTTEGEPVKAGVKFVFVNNAPSYGSKAADEFLALPVTEVELNGPATRLVVVDLLGPAHEDLRYGWEGRGTLEIPGYPPVELSLENRPRRFYQDTPLRVNGELLRIRWTYTTPR